ncbi:MAG: hypothetical protein IRZ33_03105 [Alicyclobacillaceae bacterium]|nr:hypothetical protein [Alicyclobacillaceae bacterium]
MNGWVRRACVLAAAGSVSFAAVPVGGLTAMGADRQTQFIAHYQHNAQIEATLLAKAQALPSGSSAITPLKDTVATINQQVPSLYDAEQALAALPPGDAAEQTDAALAALQQLRKKLKAEQEQLQRQSADAKKQPAGKDTVHSLLQQLRNTSQRLRQFNVQLQHAKSQSAAGRQKPLGSGLGELQSAIYHLQTVAIHYTSLWIQLARSGASAAAVPFSITGLAYADDEIRVPSAGAPAVTDVVAAWPMVKDADGNILPAAGLFRIAGPSAGAGVTIDAVTGTVTVQAGAKAGVYTVTYIQGDDSDSVELTLS